MFFRLRNFAAECLRGFHNKGRKNEQAPVKKEAFLTVNTR